MGIFSTTKSPIQKTYIVNIAAWSGDIVKNILLQKFLFLKSLSTLNHQRIYYFCLLLALELSSNVVLAQEKAIDYLALEGQARYDSLEIHYISVMMEMDSVAAFSEINSMKTYANKTQDKILSVFADFLTVRYNGIGNRKSQNVRYNSFKQIQEDLGKLNPTLLRDRLNADLEYHLGGVLYKGHLMSKNTVTHLLSADLFYRKIGYENILFADIKLSHIGLYYLNEVADYDSALKYMKEAELYVDKDPIDKYRIEVYKTYANCLAAKKQYKEAIKYNKLAIAQVRLKRDSLKIGTLSGNIGEIILNTFPNPIESEPYFQKELAFRLRYKPKGFDDLAKVYGNLCQVAGLKQNRENMLFYFDKAISTIKLHKDTVDRHSVLMSVYKNRMIADTLLGDYKSAYHYEKLHFLELMAFQKQDLKLSTSEASVKFDAERNKLQAELANQQAQNSRFWVLIVSLLLIVALIGGYLVYYRQRGKKDKLTRQLSFEQKEAERLATLDELKTRFFTNISHEFRTPLTLILSPIDDLEKKYPDESMFEPMKRHAKRLLILINQLLDLSKLDSGQMRANIQQNDLANFIKVLTNSFSSLAESRKIKFEVRQNRTEAIAYYDADKVEKILINLLSNAFKFTKNEGIISLLVNYDDSFQEVEIMIKDNGIGISAKKIERIFDRFYQIDDSHQRNYEGTGIGLALVKEMVELHKGSINIESIEGRGTTFRVKLPINQNSWKAELKNSNIAAINTSTSSDFVDLVQEQQTPKVEKKRQTDEENILLIVEDNADLRQYIRSVFENDYRIIEAIDGQDGIEKALKFIPDIVVSDLMMPRLDGFGFCKLLKSDEKTSHIPVVMLTAKANVESRIEGFELGADDYLTKPFNKEEILARVKNLITQRTLLRQKFDKKIVDLKPSEVKVSSIEEKFILKTKEIVEKHLSESEFDIEKFANEMDMTSVVLRRKLKAISGQTINEFVRNYRLQRAADLLSKRTGSVSEIAYQVGFESLSYFTKVFQEEFGINPSDFSLSKNNEN